MQGNVETRVGIFVLLAIGVFIYMGFRVGAFRFDRAKYAEYVLYFNDISGLSRKADVKIAGVKVGWVESLKLVPDHDLRAQANVMVLKEYDLYGNAHAIVRQDGLLGPKYIELVPGDPLLPRIAPGQALGEPAQAPVSIDELLQQFKDIASNVSDVTQTLRDVLGTSEGKEQLSQMFESLTGTAERLSVVSDVLERSFVRNEDNFDALMKIGTNFEQLSDTLNEDVFPAFKESVEKISDVVDRDFSRVATRLESSSDALEQASIQARDSLRGVGSIAEKIDEGQGLLGKLINEDETYHDLKAALYGVKKYLTEIERFQIIFDVHSEVMYRPGADYKHSDSKGFFNIRIHPSEDYFYLVQILSSERGFIRRKEERREYTDLEGNPVDPDKLMINDNSRLRHIFNFEKTKLLRQQWRFGLQIGKIYRNVAFRVGLFENTAGVAFDLDIPFGNYFRWFSSMQLFDFRGWNRIDDRRPHLKWQNKLFFLRNMYAVFGADDFVSHNNANPFFGAGLRFGDDDVKYILSSLSGATTFACIDR